MAKKVVGILLVPIVIILLSGCKKFAKECHFNEPGIVLTFDDDKIDNWYTYLPLLDSVGVKATFFICKYNRFTAEQKRKLAIIQSHGHEIAYHSTNHYNMTEYVYKSKHTIDELVHNEIEIGLKAMKKDGYNPTTFAYPYGAHNAVIDKAILHYFKSVRALNGTNDYSKSIVPGQNNSLLFGLGIDVSSNRSDKDIENLLLSTTNNNGCVVFVAHEINSKNKYSVTLARLRQIFKFVTVHSLKYYTASEISG